MGRLAPSARRRALPVTAEVIELELPRVALGEVIRGRRWALIYTRARRRQVWAVIREVPADVKRADVAQALEDAGLAQRYQAGLAGALTLSPEARWTQPTREDVNQGRGDSLTWAELRPETKRLTVEVPGRLHSAMSRRARLENISLTRWALEALEGAVKEDESR